MATASDLNDAAIALLHSGRAVEAAAGFRAAIAASPSAESHYNLGIALKDQHRHRESVVAYYAALALRPEFAECHFNAGRAFQMLSDDPGAGGALRNFTDRRDVLLRAARHFRASAASDSAQRSAADSYRSLEEVLHQLGDAAGARAAYAAYVRRAPKDALRPRRRVACARVREALAQRAEERHGSDAPLPPRALCRAAAAPPPAAVESYRARGYAHLPAPLLAPDALAYVAAHFTAERARGGFYQDKPSAADREHDSILAKNRWALDNDALGLFVAQQLAPLVAAVSGIAVKPGFVKAAWYEEGAKLPPHRDQVQNLISISLVLSSTAGAVPSPRWPLRLVAAPPADGGPNPEANLTAAVGEGLIFDGRDFLHWRPCCLPAGEHALVLLLHYVATDFPEAACEARLAPDEPDMLRHECMLLGDDGESDGDGGDGDDGEGGGEPNAGDGVDDWALDGERRRCDARAEAWSGPMYEVGLRDPSLAARRRAGGGTVGGHLGAVLNGERFLLYSPCVYGRERDYCSGQFNNQLHLLTHAAAVAAAMRRTLVVPPFLWMEHQMASEQRWYPASHFLDLCTLRRRQPVIELDAFAAAVQNASAGLLSHYLYPPYIVPEDDDAAFNGRWFARFGLRFAHRRRMSPHSEARQATSGRSDDAPYAPGEGRRYWRAAALHLGRHQRELGRMHAKYDRLEYSGGGGGSVAARRAAEEEELNTRHLGELLQWGEIADAHPELAGEPLDGATEGLPDVVAFDFAPSYSFRLERFDFDAELRGVQRALRFAPALERAADAAAAVLFGGERYVAAHLRRDGYEGYCAGSGLGYYGGRRYGFAVAPEMCFPSVAAVAAALDGARRRHGARRVLLATNSRDANELAELRERVEYSRWTPPPTFGATPELVPAVELLLCARAAAFVGTVSSTFTATVVAQRDLRGEPRNATGFFGVEEGWWRLS